MLDTHHDVVLLFKYARVLCTSKLLTQVVNQIFHKVTMLQVQTFQKLDFFGYRAG